MFEQHRGHVDRLEKACVSEAQETAHLLHHVVDERSLVHDFPWWQMISCLICASSILLVASAFTGSQQQPEDLHRNTLDEDAETCLKVFEALSINSDAARVARHMMEKLKVLKTRSKSAYLASLSKKTPYPDESSGHDGSHHREPHIPLTEEPSLHLQHSTAATAEHCGDDGMHGFSLDHPDSWSGWRQWPSEISDSMTWSAQFFNMPYDPSGEGSSTPFNI